MKTENRQCNRCKGNFVLEEDDFSFYEKMGASIPGECPNCRFKARALWRNEMTLYNRKCDKTGEPIISMYNPKSDYLVVSHDYYKSDKWNPGDYAMDYDLNKPFFEQLDELFKKVLKRTTYISDDIGGNVNSDYCNFAGGLKNCYLVFNTGPAEESLYTRGVRHSQEIADSYYGFKSELIYECVSFSKSSKIIYGKNISGCVDCHFVSDLSGCTNCFGCVNLRNKSHHIFNKEVSKEEYDKFTNEILGSYFKIEEFKKKFIEFKKEQPARENNNLKSINSTGDYLIECKNVKNSFEETKCEDSKYLFATKETKDSIGATGFGFRADRLLECVATGYSSNIIGSCNITHSQNIIYSVSLHNCHDCIGCDGLRNKEYCILNKQYTKKEYEKIKEYIITELKQKEVYGLMIPPELAPFAYNETIGQDNMPLTKEEALSLGYKWEEGIQVTIGKETLQPEEISDHINNIKDEITKEVLKCIDCQRNYKITEQELLFYRKMVLPIPRKCFFCRHQDRVQRRGPYKFWDRKCAHCNKDIKTNYSPDRSEIVYCEQCYQQEVI